MCPLYFISDQSLAVGPVGFELWDMDARHILTEIKTCVSLLFIIDRQPFWPRYIIFLTGFYSRHKNTNIETTTHHSLTFHFHLHVAIASCLYFSTWLKVLCDRWYASAMKPNTAFHTCCILFLTNVHSFTHSLLMTYF